MVDKGSDPAPEATRTPSGSPPLKILVVDDDELVRSSLELCLNTLGHEVLPCSGPDHATAAVERSSFDLVLLDLLLSETSGLDLIPDLLERDPSLKIVMMTGYGSVESAVEAMRRGAYEYVTKPVSTAELEVLTQRVAELRMLEKRVAVLEADAGKASPATHLESRHATMARAVSMARDVAESDATVLLLGESGTGKGVLARAIHAWSPRAEAPFAVVSCPALSADLLRSELFGHVKGAFTGAIANKIGKIEFADGGTLFLDEIGELPLDIQPRLLRFLQDREYERVGDPEPRRADVRLIAATNANLERAVEAGEFREDLYYRLNVIQIEVPPLRSRPDDIPGLAENFLLFFASKYGKSIRGFTNDAIELLRTNSWPGNVRELQNAIERAVILARTKAIGVSLLPKSTSGGLLGGLGLEDPDALPTLEGMEERYIRHVMEVADSVENAAQILGIAPSTLWRRRRKYGI